MTTALLAALQVADSAFPTGGFAFSWGLEAALEDGRVNRRSFPGWLAVELLQRWRPFDRPAVAGAWGRAAPPPDPAAAQPWTPDVALSSRRPAPNPARPGDMTEPSSRSPVARPLLAWNAEIDLLLWAEPLRLRSLEAGAALSAAAARLGTPLPPDLHFPVAQGALFRAMDLPLELALAASAHAAAQALASAAVRLGLVGALEGQAALAALRPALAEALVPPGPDELPAAFAPISEIAMLRPVPGRLFVN